MLKKWIACFCGRASLKSLDLSSFNTYNVENMSYMFSKCLSLISLDLTSFNTNNIKEKYSMFDECLLLKKENIKINE